MKLEILIPERETDGLCPKCHEHTTAGESCCSRGAIVEGGLVTDEEALEPASPTVCVNLLVGASREAATAVHRALHAAGLRPVMFGAGSPQEDLWSINIFVTVDQIPKAREVA